MYGELVVYDPGLNPLQACEESTIRQCMQLALAFERGPEPFRDLNQSVELYQVACDRGLTEGCQAASYARWLSGGTDEARELERSRSPDLWGSRLPAQPPFDLDPSEVRPVVEGFPPRSQIEWTVQSRSAGFQMCYWKELYFDPTIRGRIVTSFKIGGSGAVEWAELEHVDPNLDYLGGCVRDVFSTLVFDPREGGGEISSYSFVFRPVTDP